MEVKKNRLLNLIEPHFEKDLIQDSYEIKTIKAKDLLTHTRFDLSFKLLYLELMDKDLEFAKKIYKEHIRALSLDKFIEPGNEEKSNIDKFIEEYHKTFKDIQNNGFDSSKTVIPLSKNGSIANGAHRVASAIYLDIDVDCVEIDTVDHIYDYNFFYSRNVSSDMIDIVASKFVEYADNVHVVFIWPTAQGHDEKIKNMISSIVYRKEIKLTPNGAHNLLSQIYYGEEWLGSVENDFRGSKGKLVECFKNFNPVRIIAFQADNLDEVLVVKDKLRNIFNIGKHSIHITDTKDEAIRVSRLIFNNNSIHFLNYAKPNKYINIHKKIDVFKEFIGRHELNANDIMLDNEVVLSTYGLREAKYTDFLYNKSIKILNEFEDVNIHDEELHYYQNEKNDLIYNPKNYYYFNDLKFRSLNELYKLKKKSADEKDTNDVKMMEALIKKNDFKKKLSILKQSFYYGKIKAKYNFIMLLKTIGLYGVIKTIVSGTK